MTLSAGNTFENVIGGDLNDFITGNTLNNVLLGKGGNDTLQGGTGTGRDFLFGGSGIDSLNGGDGDDLLIGGTTSRDADLTALNALMSEWARTDLGYQDRIDHLTGAVAGGNNGPFFLILQQLFEADLFVSL